LSSSRRTLRQPVWFHPLCGILPRRSPLQARYRDWVAVSRVCIHADRDGRAVAVDVVLPARAPVAELLPMIVDLIGGPTTPSTTPRRWRLDRLADPPLEDWLSLADNGIRDGDLLLLHSDQEPPLGVTRIEPWHQAVATPSPVGRLRPDGLGGLATVMASMALASTAGSEHAMVSLVVAAVGVTLAVLTAVTTGYPEVHCLAVVCVVGATGFIVVPSTAATPNVFLAATGALAAALVMLRLSGRVCIATVAAAVVCVPTAAATLVTMPALDTGLALTTGSLALLALAPRLALTAMKDAESAHATLTGLVAGSAAGATAGAVTVAITANAGTPAHIVFEALIGAVLLLRARTYVDPLRQLALVAAGLASVAVCVVALCIAHRELVGPIAGVLIVVGLAASRAPALGDTTARLLDRLEYAALAAVVPVALWTGGVLP
jgi:hypothetical protein